MASAMGYTLRTAIFFAGLILVDGAITWTTPASGDATLATIKEDHGATPAVYEFKAVGTAAVTLTLVSPLNTFIFTAGAAATTASATINVNTVANQMLDYDTAPTIVVIVRAVEAAGTPVTSSGTLTLSLVDVNEPPVTTCEAVKKIVPDGLVAGTVVATILFADPDAGDTVTHTFIDGNAASHFAIAGTTGVVTVAAGVTLSSANQYTLTIKAVDNDATPLSSTAILTVCVGTCSSGAVVFFYTSLLTLLCGLLANFL